MRPQHSMFMQHSAAGHVGGPRNALGAGVPFGASGPMGGPQRPPNVQVNPEGMPIGSQQEWRHIMMSQQQNMSFNSQGGGGPQMRQNAFNAGAHQGKSKFSLLMFDIGINVSYYCHGRWFHVECERRWQ